MDDERRMCYELLLDTTEQRVLHLTLAAEYLEHELCLNAKCPGRYAKFSSLYNVHIGFINSIDPTSSFSWESLPGVLGSDARVPLNVKWATENKKSFLLATFTPLNFA